MDSVYSQKYSFCVITLTPSHFSDPPLCLSGLKLVTLFSEGTRKGSHLPSQDADATGTGTEVISCHVRGIKVSVPLISAYTPPNLRKGLYIIRRTEGLVLC